MKMRKQSNVVHSEIKIMVSRPSDEFDEFDSGPYQEMNPPTRNSGFSNEYLDLDCSPNTEDVYEEMRDAGETVYDVPTSEYKKVEK